MADQFAEAFKRYWGVIAAVAVSMIFVGNIYVAILRDIDGVRSDLRDYITERSGLLRDINGRFERIEDRLDRLEAQ